jgi:hypothetical protein
MQLEGKIWKSGKFWLVEVSSIDVCTQGLTRDEALKMIADAIESLLLGYYPKLKNLNIQVDDYKDLIGITVSDNSLLMAFVLKRQREISKATVREVSERMGSKSPNAYAQYERGKMKITVDQYERLLQAVNPDNHPHLRIM